MSQKKFYRTKLKNSFANRLSSFSYVDSYIFSPRLHLPTTQLEEGDMTVTPSVTQIVHGPVGRPQFHPTYNVNCDLKVANIYFGRCSTRRYYYGPYITPKNLQRKLSIGRPPDAPRDLIAGRGDVHCWIGPSQHGLLRFSR